MRAIAQLTLRPLFGMTHLQGSAGKVVRKWYTNGLKKLTEVSNALPRWVSMHWAVYSWSSTPSAKSGRA